LFKGNLNPTQIITDLGLYFGIKIAVENTLIFFDEIQTVPEALTSLKYFFEQMPELHLIAANSLLGVCVGKSSSFPVGKVNLKTLYPLSFKEYLIANNEQLLVESLVKKENFDAITSLIHEKLQNYLKRFLFLGGMPEVVQNYLDKEDIASARAIQLEIVAAYQRDFSKYTNKNQIIKTASVWDAIPYQLAKENKKFTYTTVKKNTRASYYEASIFWLKNAGLIHLAYNISIPKLPLGGYANNEKFKIYSLDTGLLGAMLGVSSAIITNPTQLFTEYNGAFIENFVATELIKSSTQKLFYWTSKSDAEVDFVLQIKDIIIPLEVKSGLSKNLKSIRSYASKYKPKFICRASPRNFYQDNDFINIPLYALFICKRLLGNN